MISVKESFVQDSPGHIFMEVDHVPLSQLPSRYGIDRSAFYTRLKDLKIEPEKQGKRAFLDASQRMSEK